MSFRDSENLRSRTGAFLSSVLMILSPRKIINIKCICCLTNITLCAFQVTKNLRDIQGQALTHVVEKLKSYGAVPGVPLWILPHLRKLFAYDLPKLVLLPSDFQDSAPVTSTASHPKSNTRVGKAGSNTAGDRAPKHGTKSASSVCYLFFCIISHPSFYRKLSKYVNFWLFNRELLQWGAQEQIPSCLLMILLSNLSHY